MKKFIFASVFLFCIFPIAANTIPIAVNTQIINTCTTARTQLVLASKDPNLACDKVDLERLGVYKK
jgi:hypothetical protein